MLTIGINTLCGVTGVKRVGFILNKNELNGHFCDVSLGGCTHTHTHTHTSLSKQVAQNVHLKVFIRTVNIYSKRTAFALFYPAVLTLLCVCVCVCVCECHLDSLS